jgi:hypothetical protein
MPSTRPWPLRLSGTSEMPRDRDRVDRRVIAPPRRPAGSARPGSRRPNRSRRSRCARRRRGRRSRAPRRAHLETDILEQMPQDRPAPQRDGRPARDGCVAAEIELAADHQLRDLVLVRLGGVERAAILAVAQHADPVGDLEDLFHPVGDVDDPDALRLADRRSRRTAPPFRHRSATRWARRRSPPWRRPSARGRSRPSAGWRSTGRRPWCAR